MFSPRSDHDSSASSRVSGWSTGQSRGRSGWGDDSQDYSNTSGSMSYANSRGTSHRDHGGKQARHPAATTASRSQPPSTPAILESHDLALVGMPTDGDADLFPYITARLKQVKLQVPQFDDASRHPDVLRRKMLSVIFGWDGDVAGLIQQERSQHAAGSYSNIILTRWLGEIGAEDMDYMEASQPLTRSDWMLFTLALLDESHNRGEQMVVRRLLEHGSVHPAVAILLALHEINEAIEVYVSRKRWMETVLLTSLTCPYDWQRIAQLLKKWGEAEVHRGDAGLAVRCLSCAAIDTSEPWFSPRSQDAVYAAQQAHFTGTGLSSADVNGKDRPQPMKTPASRMTVNNAGLRLNTDTKLGSLSDSDDAFEAAATARPAVLTAIERMPGTRDMFPRSATSRRDHPQSAFPGELATVNKTSRREPKTPLSALPKTGFQATALAEYPLDARDDPRTKSSSRLISKSRKSRKPSTLAVNILPTAIPAPGTGASDVTTSSAFSTGPLTGNSIRSMRSGVENDFISSVDEARRAARRGRAESRRRAPTETTEPLPYRPLNGHKDDASHAHSSSKKDKLRSPLRENARGRTGFGHPQTRRPAPGGGWEHNRAASPDSDRDIEMSLLSKRSEAKVPKRSKHDKATFIAGLAPIAVDDRRGRSQTRDVAAGPRSPSLPLLSSKRYGEDDAGDQIRGDGRRRVRARSSESITDMDLYSSRISTHGHDAAWANHGLRVSVRTMPPMQGQSDAAALEERTDPDEQSTRPSSRYGRSYQRDEGSTIVGCLDRPEARPSESELRKQRLDRLLALDDTSVKRPGSKMPSATLTIKASNDYSHREMFATPKAMLHPSDSRANANDSMPAVQETPHRDKLLQEGLSFAMSDLTNSPADERRDAVGPLLPSTVFGSVSSRSLPRSNSAPPDKQQAGLSFPARIDIAEPAETKRGVRQISPPSQSSERIHPLTSIDAAVTHQMHDSSSRAARLALHPLQIPPSPQHDQERNRGEAFSALPLGVHDAEPDVYERSHRLNIPRSATASPSTGRRGAALDEYFAARYTSTTSTQDRDGLDQATHARTVPRSPVNEPAPGANTFIPSHARTGSAHRRAQSPYEQAEAFGSAFPWPETDGTRLNEISIAPMSLPSVSGSSTRSKDQLEVRANMPPKFLRSGTGPAYDRGGFL